MTISNTLTRREAAEYLRTKYGIRCSVASLARMAFKGTSGPKFYKGPHEVAYTFQHLDEWAATRLGTLMCSTKQVA